MSDPFFTQTRCDRCGGSLAIRKMSWFTSETICLDCAKKEDEIRAQLRKNGVTSSMEGCGYVPDPEKVKA